MQTQRDHVHAHQFMMGRLSSALVLGDPSGAEVPGRRALTGLVFGVLIAVLVVAGFGVYGWIVPGGSTAYRQPGLILVEKETGSRYVYADGLLHPVIDRPAAMLWQGPSAKVKLISQASLADVPRGDVLGIPDGPREIPAPQSFVAGPWLACLSGRPGDSGRGGLGMNLDPRAAAAPIPPERLIVVRDPDDKIHLIAQGSRFRVTDDAVLVALGISAGDAIPATEPWLSQLPAGPDLAPARIDGEGRDGPRIAGRSHDVGTLFRQNASAAGEQFFVLRKDGLAALSETEFLFAGVRSRSAPVTLAGADLLDAPRSADRTLLDRLPDLAGAAEHRLDDRILCLRQTPTAANTVYSVLVEAPRTMAVDANGRGVVFGPAGGGMAVYGVPVAPGTTPPVVFVSSGGVAFALKDAQAAAALKINQVRPVPFPRELLATLRQGPTLSREAVTFLAEG
ncbi:type VII secretion protein EccB [Micromonospora profundi]|uniref:type VII secretion protein EccB n=1 Tax=Micromonospora profundi TaxID=1420889 RepID=UPI003665C1E0